MHDRLRQHEQRYEEGSMRMCGRASLESAHQRAKPLPWGVAATSTQPVYPRELPSVYTEASQDVVLFCHDCKT